MVIVIHKHFQNVGKPGLRAQYLTSGFPCGAMSGDISGCHNWGVTTSRWVEPGMLINILRCPGHPSKNYVVQNIISAKFDKSCTG